jgi:hypothetical protein
MGVRFRTGNVLVKVTRLEDFDGHIKLRLRTWTRISLIGRLLQTGVAR